MELNSDVTEPVDGRSQRAAATRLAILQATQRVVDRDGVARVTLDHVAAEAGVSKGGLLYHFSSKRDLVGALLEHILAGADRRLGELTTSSEPGAFCRAYLDYVRSGEHQRRGTAAGILASAALHDGDLVQARERFAGWQDQLVDDDGVASDVALLTRVVADGFWLIDLFELAAPTAEQREAVLDLVQGLVDRSAACPSGGEAGER